MAITELNRARRKLALEIAEAVDWWWAHCGVFDPDECAENVIAPLIPDTRVEAQAELDALEQSMPETGQREFGPSAFGELRDVLRLDGLGIHAVLKSAKEAVEERNRLRAEFTGESTQSPLEQIRAKCEQYWNEPFGLCPEEMHSILEFIHRLAVSAEAQRDSMTIAEASRRTGKRMVLCPWCANCPPDLPDNPVCKLCQGAGVVAADDVDRMKLWEEVRTARTGQ